MQILNIKQAKETIKLIVSGGKKLDDRIHTVGCSGLSHYVEHGDLTTLTELCHAMPKSSRGNALKYWVTKNANVQWNKKAYAGKGGFVKAKKDEPANVSLDDAIATPFWQKTDTEAAIFDEKRATAMFKSLITKCQKAIAEGTLKAEELPKEVQAALTA